MWIMRKCGDLREKRDVCEDQWNQAALLGLRGALAESGLGCALAVGAFGRGKVKASRVFCRGFVRSRRFRHGESKRFFLWCSVLSLFVSGGRFREAMGPWLRPAPAGEGRGRPIISSLNWQLFAKPR